MSELAALPKDKLLPPEQKQELKEFYRNYENIITHPPHARNAHIR